MNKDTTVVESQDLRARCEAIRLAREVLEAREDAFFKEIAPLVAMLAGIMFYRASWTIHHEQPFNRVGVVITSYSYGSDDYQTIPYDVLFSPTPEAAADAWKVERLREEAENARKSMDVAARLDEAKERATLARLKAKYGE